MKLKTLLLVVVMFCGIGMKGQNDIPSTTPVIENFNSMGTSTANALPLYWRIHNSATPSYTAGTRDLGVQVSSGAPSAGNTYNWGSTATERAPGVMTSGSFSSPSSIIGYYRNTNASNLTSVSVSYDLERYRINSAAASVQFFYSTNGSTWTAVTAGDVATASLLTGTSAYAFNPPNLTLNKSAIVVTFPTPIANNGEFYLRWNLNTAGSNSQGLGIDNVSVTGTFAVSTSSASTIDENSSFSYPTNIDYNAYQENTNLTAINSLEVAQFNIKDGGATTDTDTQATELTSITFSITNRSLLRRLALYDGSTEIAEVAVTGNTVTFPSISLTAADGASKQFSLRASFSGSVTDNQQFSFTVNSATANVSKSTFAATNAGSAVSSTTGDRNRIEVTATILVFDINPVNVLLNAIMSPAPTIVALDIQANQDLDYTGSVNVTVAGSTFGSGATTIVTAIAGQATLNNLLFSTTATGVTLNGAASGLIDTGNSPAFTVSNPAPVINSSLTSSSIYGSPYNYTISASNLPSSYNASNLPTGLSINTATGSISGTPTAGTGTYNISISATNGGGTDIKTLALTITAKSLTITGISAANKIYDRNITASLTGTASLIGIVGSDVVSISGTPNAVFANATVSTTKTVTVSGYTLTDTNAGNYTLIQPTGLTANITAKALTVTTPVANNKIYDTTTAATITGTLSGVISPDTVTLSGTGTFASSNVGTTITVTSTSTIGGAAATNYTLTQPTGLTANITQASQTITFGALANQTVGGTDFNLTATATSNLAVSYTSSDLTVATITGSTVTIVGPGTTTITASQPGNTNYSAATNIPQSLTVAAGPCHTETFSAIGINTSYATRTWAGDGGTWTATDAREDQTITGKAITIRTGAVTSPTFTDGIASLTLTTKFSFSETGSAKDLIIAVNGTTVGTILQTEMSSTPITRTFSGINISGSVVITLTSSSGARYSIDDVNWTCFASCTPPANSATLLTVNNPTPSSLSANFTRGNGDGVIIIAKPGSIATSLTNGTAYNLGDIVGGGTVVYKGTASGPSTVTSQIISSLAEGTQYYFSIYEYNATTNCYQTIGLTSNAYTLSSEPTGHSAFSTTLIAYNQINLSFPTSPASLGADGFVILRRADGITPTTTGVLDGVAPASWSLPTNTTLLTTTTSGTTYNNTGLTDSTNYCYLLIPYNWNASNSATYNYYISGAVPSVCGTTSTAPGLISDISTDTAYTYTSNINYLNWQSASISNATSGTNGSVGVHKITIRDGGASASDSDSLPTILNSLSFTYIGTANTIKSAALFTPSDVLIGSSVSAGANTITFPALSGTEVTAPDNGSVSLILRVTFNNTVTDNQKLVFTVNSAISANSSISSQFIAANAGAATSDNSTDDKNRIEVTADRLAFAQQPVNTSINTPISSVTVSANDTNGNRDLDFGNSVAITSSGTLTGTPVSVTALNGLASYSTLTHTAAQTGVTLTATTTGLANNTVISNVFDITTITYANNDYRTKSSGTWLGTTTSTWQQYNSGTGSWADSGVPSASTASSIYIMDGHTITTGSSFGNSVNIKVMSGGSFISSYNSTANSLSIYNGGTFIFQNNSLVINSGFEIEDGGTFIFNYNSNEGSSLVNSLWKGVENFHPNSNFVIKNHDTGSGKDFLPVDTNITAQTYNGVTSYFGNLIIDNNAGATGTFRLSSGGNFSNKILTHNNLIFRSSNSNFIITDTDLNLTINGDIIIESGFGNNISGSTSAITAAITVNGDVINSSTNTLNLANNPSSSSITLNVAGNILLSSGALNLNATSGSTSIVNLKGDLTVGTGATLTSTSATGSTFNFSGTGDGLTNAGTQSVSIASTAASRNQNITFNTNSGSYVQLANSNLELGTNSNFTAKTGSIFDFGFNTTTPLVLTVVSGVTSAAFTSQTGSTLKITSPDGIIKTANTTNGNVQGILATSRTFNQAATFHYIGKANQVTGDAITTASSAKTIICELNTDNLQLAFTNGISILAPGLLNIQKGQVIETATGYMTSGSTGGLTMEANTLYQIPVLTATVTDLIPRLDGISNAYNLNGGTIQLNGAGDQKLRGQRSYRNLTFSTSGTKTVSSSPNSINGTITTENTAILNVENKTMGGAVTNLTMTGSSRYIDAGNGIKPDAQGTYLLNTGTAIEFNNSDTTLEEIRLSPDYYNIDISGSNTGTATLSSSIHLQAGATFTIKSTGTFKHINTTGFAKGLATAISSNNHPTLFFEPGSTVEYTGGDQGITALPLSPLSSTYSNLKISGTGQKTIPGVEVLIGNDLIVADSGAEIDIDANQLLTVTNVINAPTTTEKIMISNTGNLVQINEGVTNSGRINMRRTSRSMANNDYIYWGSPVAESVNMPSGIHAAYMWDLYGTQDGAWNYFSSTVPGRGFITRVGAGQLNFDFKGTPNTGQIDVTALNYDGGTGQTGNAILLANPYPSAIYASDFVNDPDNSELKGTLYFWTSFTPITGGQYTSNDYASWNITGATAISDFSNSLGLVPTGKIGAGQGFFTEMETSGTISFHNSMRIRTLTDNTQFFRSAASGPAEPEQNRIWLNLTNSNSAFRQALIGYVTGATNEYERLYDGNSFTDNEISIYSLVDSKPLVIQGRALPFDTSDLVPLGIKITTPGTYNIAIDHTDGVFANGQNIYLQDLLLNTIYDLKSGQYSFTAATGTFNDRFVLRYTNETLGTGTFDPGNNLQLAVNKNILKIRSASDPIEKITVFDISGRKVYEQEAIESNEFQATDIVLNHQALIVKITLVNGMIINRKIVY